MPEKPTYEELEQRIKELEAAEAELQESRDKYQGLFEAANDAIFVTSAETGIIMDANEMAERLIGRSATVHSPSQRYGFPLYTHPLCLRLVAREAVPR